MKKQENHNKAKIINGKNMEWFKSQPEQSIDLIITSPPYNLGGDIDKKKNKLSGNVLINSYKDNLPEKQYQKQQLLFLNECFRVLKNKGALFYNHKNRYKNNEMISPFEWIFKSELKIKQEIIWNRLTTADRENSKFAPLDEKIFWLYKEQTFRLKKGAQNFENIWQIPRPTSAENKGHKATFPYELIYRIINSLNIDKNIVILDPYLGTGTTLQVAHNLGFQNIIGIELMEKWWKISNKKVFEKKEYKEYIPVIKNGYKKEIKKQIDFFDIL